MDKFYFGQALYAQNEWWTLLQPLAANTDCFLVIERGAEMPADVYVVKQTESDKKWERTYDEMGQLIIV